MNFARYLTAGGIGIGVNAVGDRERLSTESILESLGGLPHLPVRVQYLVLPLQVWRSCRRKRVQRVQGELVGRMRVWHCRCR